jgi:hypothetical protein
MKAHEVYEVLASAVGPPLLERGFRRLHGSRLAFQRLVRGTFQTVGFRCDKNGWDPYAGSQFFVSFTTRDAPACDTAGRHDQHLFFFLTDAELAGARDFRNSVVARIPRPPAAYFQQLQTACDKLSPTAAAEIMAGIRMQFEPDAIPYRRHQETGLRYWMASDVAWWATLIVSVLPRALEQMDAWSAEEARPT